MSQNNSKMEEEAIIIDYLSLGHVNAKKQSYKGDAICQAIGTQNFGLLELSPKKDADVEIMERVYIGKGKREKIDSVKRKLKFEDLTATSRIEIEYALEEIIKSDEYKYIKFINEAGPISTRLHKLELLPGIGKKHREAILKARDEKEFENFDDMRERVPVIPDPVTLIARRIILELDESVPKRGKNKYNLFTRTNVNRK